MATMQLILSLSLFIGSSQCFLLDDNSLQSLMSQIIHEKQLRANMATEMNALKNNLAALATDYKANKCFSDVVAFSVSVTKDITNFGNIQRIIYDEITTNVGGAYDPRHGTFRAPVDGVYEFAVSILQGTSSMWLGLELIKDNQVIARVKTGDNGYWNMGSNAVNVRLQEGDDVWVRHMNVSDSRHVVAESGLFTAFSGHLIY